jgi:hypothetical protein
MKKWCIAGQLPFKRPKLIVAIRNTCFFNGFYSVSLLEAPLFSAKEIAGFYSLPNTKDVAPRLPLFSKVDQTYYE